MIFRKTHPKHRSDPHRHALRWGFGTLLVIAIAVTATFGGLPRTGPAPFELRALMRTDTHLVKGSAVRIAGVNIGKVTRVEPGPRGSGLALATMAIEDEGLPIREDATARIRPRLLLEGNFFVDLRPGTPDGRPLRSGETLPADAISASVQVDRVLSDLPAPTRTSLQGTLQGLGGAWGGAAADGGPTGGEALNDALVDGPDALLGTATVTRAMLGERPADLSRAVRGTSQLLTGLARDRRQLADLVTSFERTMAAFGDRAPDLRRTVSGLDATLVAADPALDAVSGALAPTRALAAAMRPGVRDLPATITQATPWLTQTTRLLGADELGGLSGDLEGAVTAAARGAGTLRTLTTRLDQLNDCLLRKLLPVSEQAVVDPPLTTGVPVWEEGLQALAGLAGSGQAFDGNGVMLRSFAGGGDVPVKTSPLPTQGELFGNAVTQPLGTRPKYPGAKPPVRTGVACSATPIADLTAATGEGP
jgi:phospholipid/cholesterol/gamma-HCH transport system substrate-binding protein